jgi:hypothetical protein
MGQHQVVRTNRLSAHRADLWHGKNRVGALHRPVGSLRADDDGPGLGAILRRTPDFVSRRPPPQDSDRQVGALVGGQRRQALLDQSRPQEVPVATTSVDGEPRQTWAPGHHRRRPAAEGTGALAELLGARLLDGCGGRFREGRRPRPNGLGMTDAFYGQHLSHVTATAHVGQGARFIDDEVSGGEGFGTDRAERIDGAWGLRVPWCLLPERVASEVRHHAIDWPRLAGTHPAVYTASRPVLTNCRPVKRFTTLIKTSTVTGLSTCPSKPALHVWRTSVCPSGRSPR